MTELPRKKCAIVTYMKIVLRTSYLLTASLSASLLLLCAPLVAQTMPPLKRQPTPAKVVEEHMAAFSSCDWPRLMAQFPDNVEFFGPNGQVIRGKAALGQMFAQVVKSPSQGGTCGLKVVAEHTFVVGDTINVQWRADSPLLKEPYRGADAYETHDGLMAAQVTTWNPADFKVEGTSKQAIIEPDAPDRDEHLRSQKATIMTTKPPAANS